MEAWQKFQGRENELITLIEAWEKSRQGEAQCVVMLADSGYGKTRIIHEFYRRISLNEYKGSGKNYWPDNLPTNLSKRGVNPDFTNFESKGEIPWLWWGISWDGPSDDEYGVDCGMKRYQSHLERHIDALKKKRAVSRGVKDLSVGLSKTALDCAPLPNVVGGLQSIKEVWDTSQNLSQARKNQRVRFDPGKKAEEDVEAAIQLLSAYLDPKIDDAEDIPVVLVLDDTQWADPMTLRYACDLYSRARMEGWPLLLLVTHWETEWKQFGAGEILLPESKGDEWKSFRDVEATLKQREGGLESIHILPIGKLENNLIMDALLSAFPGLDDKDQTHIKERCDGNIGICQEFIEILKGRDDWFVGQDLGRAISKEAKSMFRIATMTTGSRTKARLDAIKNNDKILYEFLRLGATQGVSFYHELLSETAMRLDKGDAKWVKEQADRAEKSHSIISNSYNISEFRHRIYREDLKDRMSLIWSKYRQTLCGVLDDWWENLPQGMESFSVELLQLYSILLEEEGDLTPLRSAEVLVEKSRILQDQSREREANATIGRAVELTSNLDTSAIGAEVIAINNELTCRRICAGNFDNSTLSSARLNYERASDILDSSHTDVWKSMRNLAEVLEAREDHEEAATLFFELFQTMRRELGPEAPDTLESMQDLGVLLNSKGNNEGAKALLRYCLEIRERVLGEEHHDTWNSMTWYSIILWSSGSRRDQDEAVALHRRCLRIKEHVLGRKDRSTLQTASLLGNFLSAEGDLDGAEPILRYCLEMRSIILGDQHTDTLSSMRDLARLLQSKEDYKGAEPLLRSSLDICERLFGPHHEETLKSMEDLARLLEKMEEFEEAELQLRHCFEGREHLLGPECRDTLESMADLAIFLEDREQFDAAEHLYLHILETRERVFGSGHRDTLKSMDRLVWLAKNRSDLEEVESLRRVLEIHERVLGEEHSDTLESMRCLGWNLTHKDDYDNAEPLLRRCLDIRERVLGAEHHDTLESMDSLGMLLLSKYDYEKAKPLLQRCFEIRERLLGAEHRDTLSTKQKLSLVILSLPGKTARSKTPECINDPIARDLARLSKSRDDKYQIILDLQVDTLGAKYRNTLESMGRSDCGYLLSAGEELIRRNDYDKAEPLLRRVLEIREHALGEEHPDTLESMRALQHLFLFKKDDDEAERISGRILEIRERVLGEEHRDTLESMDRLAMVMCFKKDYENAEPLRRRILEIRERIHGDEHLDTLESMQELQRLFLEKNDYDNAELLLRRILDIRERVLGEEHPDTLESMDSLAMVMHYKKDYENAELLRRRILNIHERVLGEEHPNTLKSMDSLAKVMCYNHDYDNAEPLRRRILEIRERVLGEEHPDTLESIEEFQSILLYRQDYDNAEILQRQMLKTRKRLLKEEQERSDILESHTKECDEESHQISYNLLEQYGQNPEDIRAVWESLLRVGEIKEREEDLSSAKEHYEKSLQVARDLLKNDGKTAERLNFVSVSLNKVGDVELTEGDFSSAKYRYVESLQIRRNLLERYGESPESLRDVSRSLDKMGNIEAGLGAYSSAKRYYEESLQTHRNLLKLYKESPEGLYYESLSLCRIGELEKQYWNFALAKARNQEALQILNNLYENDENSLKCLLLMSASYWYLSEVTEGQERRDYAEKGVKILLKLQTMNQLDKRGEEWLPILKVRANGQEPSRLLVPSLRKLLAILMILLTGMTGFIALGLLNPWLWIVAGPSVILLSLLILVDVRCITSLRFRNQLIYKANQLSASD